MTGSGHHAPAHMTDSVDHPPVPMPTSPPDELDFEVETETMADGRQIHYYHWPEPEPPAERV
jgi:hypothetical protein